MRNISSMTVKEIAEMINGELYGSADKIIKGVNTLEKAQSGQIAFLANAKYSKWVDTTKASCIVLSNKIKIDTDIPVIRVDNADIAFGKILDRFFGSKKHPFEGVSRNAMIHKDSHLMENVKVGDFVKIEKGVSIGRNTVIYPNAYIGEDTVVGDNCVLYPNVTLMDNIRIGNNVIIHPGSVIGSEGFGYSTENGVHRKIPQIGSVVIEDDVEIGSNVCIDRGSPGDTVIGKGTKIDNLVQIAHNVKTGKNCFIISQVGIAGSTIIEDSVFLAGQAGVVGHITIGQSAKVGAQAGVTHDIKPGQLVSGYPATDHRQAKRINALVKKLPKLFKQVEKLNKIIGQKNE